MLAGIGGQAWLRAGDVFYLSGHTDTPYVRLTTQVGDSSISGNVEISGRYADGRYGHAIIVGDRSPLPYSSIRGSSNNNLQKGRAVFGIEVSYVSFRWLEFRNLGSGCLLSTSVVNGSGTRDRIIAEYNNFINFRRGNHIRA